MDVKNLSSLSGPELRSFFDSFDHVFCDCDGVIWYLYSPLPGAPEAVQKLRGLDKTVRFVSNNCLRSIDVFYETLEKGNFGNFEGSLIIPTMVLLDHLKEINFDKELFVLSNSPLKEELRKNGFKVAPNGPDRIEENVAAFVTHLKDNPNVGAVVVDIDINMNFINLSMASLYLRRSDVKLIFLSSDHQIPINQKITLFGPYYFQQMLSEISKEEPLGLGKPSKALAKYINKKCNITEPKRVLFIGDALVQDISFANQNGFQSLLVLTGTTKKEQLENWSQPEDQKPNYYVDSLGLLGKLIDNM